MNTIRISKEQYQRMGSDSLVGIVVTEYPPSPITIQFEQTSMKWKRQNGGAEDIIIPEFLPMCLCGDIISLIRLGYTIKVGDYSVAPGSIDPSVCKHPHRNMNGGCDDCGDPCL